MTMRMSPTLLLAVALHALATVAAAESSRETTQRILAALEPRMRAIYERREFRPAEVAAEWLPDSSGFRLRRRDSATDAARDVFYEVRAGEPLRETSAWEFPEAIDPSVSPDGRWRVEAKAGILHLVDVSTGQATPLTENPSDRDVSYRQVRWNREGSHAVFVEADATDVPRRAVLVPKDPSYPDVRYDRFARVGGTIETLRVGVVDVAARTSRWLPIAAPPEGFYLGEVGWAGNSTDVVVEVLSRFRDKREFLVAGPAGDVTTIYTETDPAWVESAQGKNSGLTWVRGGAAFIVVTEKDGWRHAYLHGRGGEELALLTPGEYDIIDRAVVDERGGWYSFYASPGDGPRKALYRVPLDGSGTRERVTPLEPPGTHDYAFSPDARWAIHTHSTLDSPPVVDLVELPDHRVVATLEDNARLRERVASLAPRPVEFLQVDVGDGVSVDGWLLEPKDFDATRKYPVLVYVYGEPYAQTVLDAWGAAQIDFHRAVADAGYLVVSFDNRGTPAPKGAAWRRSIFGSLGPLSTEDQAAALRELARTRPSVDLSRVGIWGWSGGGSNTLNAMFRRPELYHVGIAVVPKPQPHLYNAWFQEIYMRTREVNPEGYRNAAPLNYAEGLQGRLLIITGSGETNTHVQIVEGLMNRLIELGKPFDSMVYPDRDHGLSEGTGTQVHVRMLILRYLLENLPPGPATIPDRSDETGAAAAG
jgi:dipeptidyl-peptidase-4